MILSVIIGTCFVLASAKTCPSGTGRTQTECEAAGCFCVTAPFQPGCHCVACQQDSHCTDKKTPYCSMGECTECPMMKWGLDQNCQTLYGDAKPFCYETICVEKCGGSDPWPVCYECTEQGDCKDATKPICNMGKCQPTCATDKYHCKQGIRIHGKDNSTCDANIDDKVGERCTDFTCCGGCNDDSDCKSGGQPHCDLSSNGCYECTESKQCNKQRGIATCSGHACVACDKSFPCSAPCVDGLYDCELPCDSDANCREGEVCAVNPGDSLKSAQAHRKMCQKPCSSNKDCMAFVHTCLTVGGLQFCGQCLKDEHCPSGMSCALDKYPTGTWGLCKAPGNAAAFV